MSRWRPLITATLNRLNAHRVKALFHSTAMVADYDRTVSRMAELFGLRVLEYSAADDPAIGRRGGMTWIGDGSIELGEPIVDGAPPERFVRRTGGGMQGVALWVEDFPTTTEHLAARGVPMPVTVGHFGFTSPRATLGLQFEWSDFTVPEDPRTGAPEPSFLVPPVLDVTHHAFVGAVVDDPVAGAHWMAETFGTPVTFTAPDAPPGTAVAGVSLGDCTLALYRFVPDEHAALWGRSRDRPGVSMLGLRVADLDGARESLRRAGVGILREDRGALVLDPAGTGDLEITLIEELLPGDPRDQLGVSGPS
jgi:catechol 2,3-dioxygenase-like lactoylglutathione lyase family enzyme